jgi:protein arginine N-methyltransferase 1
MKYEFTATHLPITVTMGPTSSPFWKPIILYLQEEIPVHKGDKITGTI